MLKKISSKVKFPSLIIELANNSKNYSIGQIFLSGFGIITLPIFTRILSVEDYGIISIFLYTNSVLSVVFSLGIGQPINRYYYEKKQDFGSFLFTAILFLFLFQIAVFILGILLLEQLESLVGLSRNLFLLAMCTSFFSPLVRAYQNLNIAMERSSSYSKFNIIRRMVLFAGSIMLIYVLPIEPYYSRVIGELFIIPFFLYSFIQLRRIFTLSISLKHIKYILKLCIPLYPPMLAGVIFGQVDRVIINKYLGLTDTGLYSYAYTIGTLSGIFIVSISSSWTPKFMHYLKDKRFSLINNMTGLIIMLYCILIVSLILFCQEISLVLAPDTFQAGIIVTPIVLFASFFSSHETIYTNYVLFKKKLLFIMALITILIGMLKFGLNILLIPKFGYIAASYSLIICYIVRLSGNYWLAKYLIGDSIYKLRYSYKPLLILIVALIIFYSLYISNISFLLRVFLKVVSLGLFIFVSYKIIKKQLNKIRSLELEYIKS